VREVRLELPLSGSGADVLRNDGRRHEGTQRVRLLERGVGEPPGADSTLDPSVAAQLTWLRLGQVSAPALADAAGDAGPSDAGPSEGVEWIWSARELAELPVAIGDELTLAFEYVNTGGGSVWGVQHWRLVLQREDRVLLYQQQGLDFGTYSGVTLARGAASCAKSYPDTDYRCAYIYHHELELTVPGGATATLLTGQTQTVGDYLAIHGSTTVEDYSPRLPGDQSCADLYYFATATVLTLVRRPEP
jgi:hypothetical protein